MSLWLPSFTSVLRDKRTDTSTTSFFKKQLFVEVVPVSRVDYLVDVCGRPNSFVCEISEGQLIGDGIQEFVHARHCGAAPALRGII